MSQSVFDVSFRGLGRSCWCRNTEANAESIDDDVTGAIA